MRTAILRVPSRIGDGLCFKVFRKQCRRPSRFQSGRTWFLAASPTRRSVSVKATYDGVVRLPCSLAMISTRSCCQVPTHE